MVNPSSPPSPLDTHIEVKIWIGIKQKDDSNSFFSANRGTFSGANPVWVAWR